MSVAARPPSVNEVHSDMHTDLKRSDTAEQSCQLKTEGQHFWSLHLCREGISFYAIPPLPMQFTLLYFSLLKRLLIFRTEFSETGEWEAGNSYVP